MKATLLGVGLLLLLAGSSLAQESPLQQEADSKFQARDWARAARAYEKLIQATTGAATARNVFRLGYAHYSSAHYPQAIEAWRKAEELGFPAQNVRYNIGVAYALNQQTDEAFQWLNKAVEAGFNNIATLESDGDLEALRADPRFEHLLAEATMKHPCNRSGCREFDFWVGEWDVFNPAGVQVGTNTIQRILNSCVLHESWRSARGSTGQSWNYLHPERNTWIQLWLDDSGGVIELEGGFRDNAMHLAGRNIQHDGSIELIRGSWTPLEDGRVRQFFEQSKDNGVTWYTWFDGYYVRK